MTGVYMIQIEPKRNGEKYSLEELYHIIELLRSPEGCPWDRVQTHETLIKPMIEEAYEAVDAIKKDSAEKLCEELGDVLLQVIFHSILKPFFFPTKQIFMHFFRFFHRICFLFASAK